MDATDGPLPYVTDGPPLRLAVGLGDPDLERRLLPVLSDAGAVAVVERCLAADQLLACVHRGGVDAVLAAHDLHRLGAAALAELRQTRVPLVLLAPAVDDERWRSLAAVVLPTGADAATVRRGLEAAVRGDVRPAATTPTPAERRNGPAAKPRAPGQEALAVLAVASGHGSPGRTTVAVSLAASLGSVASTVLVDLDTSGPGVAACLDADPTRNLYLIAHRAPTTAGEWDQAIARETQSLGSRSRHAVVLCGVPSVEMRTALARPFLERLIGELRQRYRYVVLDVGAELLGADVALHRAALALADQVLLVATPDLAALHQARVALGLFQAQLGVPPERVALVLNRHDRRFHWGRDEVGWHLRAPVAAVVPHDYRAAQRALAAQRPLVYERRSRAGRALVQLAGRIHGGAVALPPEPGRNGRASLSYWLSPIGRLWPRRNGRAEPAKEGGSPDGHDAVAHA